MQIRDIRVWKTVGEYSLVLLMQNFDALEGEAASFHFPSYIRMKHEIAGFMTEVANH